MAMNKAEKSRMAELEASLAVATVGSVVYTEPKPMTSEEIVAACVKSVPAGIYQGTRMIATGWGFRDHLGHHHSGEVVPIWSDGRLVGHGHEGKGGSQIGRKMYRTEREAAIALRLALTRSCGEILARADELIKHAA